MPESLHPVPRSADEQLRDKPAATRREFVVAGAALGTMGVLAWTPEAHGALPQASLTRPNTPQTIVNVAATVEVVGTIVNTVGVERVALDPATQANVRAAATAEKIHYEALTSAAIGARAITTRLWIPDEVFASATNLLATLVVGAQVSINAYLLASTVFAHAGGATGSRFARYAAELVGVEAVHRAFALQSLGRLGSDRAFMRYDQKEEVSGLSTSNKAGFDTITGALAVFKSAGFGFGRKGSGEGAFYEYDVVAARTPTAAQVGVNTLQLS